MSSLLLVGGAEQAKHFLAALEPTFVSKWWQQLQRLTCTIMLSSASGCAQMVARSKEDILAARGVKPTLSPNLNTLATVEALGVKRLLFIGVGCQARLCPAVLLRTSAFGMLRHAHLAHGCQASAAAALTRGGQITC